MRLQNDESVSIVFSIKPEHKLEIAGILKQIEHSEEEYQYLLLGKESDLLSYYPGALHYLNHFWLILPGSLEEEQKLWRRFYMIYGKWYDLLIDRENNIDCIRFLIGLLKQNTGLKPDSKIIDFGCGNGLSGDVPCDCEIIGYDFNQHMRTESEKRGIQTINTNDFYSLPKESFDGGIASYVMHMAVEEKKLKKLTEILKPGAALAANFYKNLGYERVERIFGAVGLKAEKITNRETRYGIIYVYRK